MMQIGIENIRKDSDPGKKVFVWNTAYINKWEESLKHNVLFNGPSPYINNKLGYRRPDIRFKHTPEEIAEIKKCSEDICYFAEKYCKTMTDDGISNITLRPYQKRILNDLKNHRHNIWVATRQIGKTTMSSFFILWYAIFNIDKNCVILANREATAQEVLEKLEISYINLPFFMKPGMQINNKGEMRFDNGVRLIARATSPKPVIGMTIHLLYLDEFAHVPENIVESFWTTTYPTISSSKVSKIIITSTFSGTNKFWRLYVAAEKGKNSFHPIKVDWWEVEGRDELWRQREIENLGSEEAFNQEYGNIPISNKKLLVDSEHIRKMAVSKINYIHRFINDFEKYGDYSDLLWNKEFNIDNIAETDKFVISVDPSEGIGKDYSIINIFEFTNKSLDEIQKMSTYDNENDFFKLKQIGIYRNNVIDPDDLATLIYGLVYEFFGYDKVTVIIEINRAEGQAIINKLMRNPNYFENIVFHSKHSLESDITKPGIKLNKISKIDYCRTLRKNIYENNIEITEKNTIKELEKFGIRKNGTYGSIVGHDDCVMTCVNTSPFYNSYIYDEFVSDKLDYLDVSIQNIIDMKLRSFKIDRDVNDIDYSIMRDFM